MLSEFAEEWLKPEGHKFIKILKSVEHEIEYPWQSPSEAEGQLNSQPTQYQ